MVIEILGFKYKNLKSQIILLVPIFTTREANKPNNFGMAESGLPRSFIWHLAKSDQTYGSRDINWSVMEKIAENGWKLAVLTVFFLKTK